jgi:hypothetical protein
MMLGAILLEDSSIQFANYECDFYTNLDNYAASSNKSINDFFAQAVCLR